jgi:hypothetical protein
LTPPFKRHRVCQRKEERSVMNDVVVILIRKRMEP